MIIMAEDNLNLNNKREWTTPERMHMVESIKKSIHRSMQKINPAQYKNILKGQNIYIHLCFKGEIINSQYTKVALFMGAVVYKKAYEKINAVVTNDSSYKIVKKLAAMGKPILNVLWLEACFQQKRKVPYSDFLFQEEGKNQLPEEEKSEQLLSISFENLLPSYQQKSQLLLHQFEESYNLNTLKFVEKKDKDKIAKLEGCLIPAHEIYLEGGQHRRKSQTIVSQKMTKKAPSKNKVQFKSAGNEEYENELNQIIMEGETVDEKEEDERENHQSNNQIKKSTKFIYQKYIKDFKDLEKEYDAEADEIEIAQQSDTPFFNSELVSFQASHFYQNQSKGRTQSLRTPSKVEKSESGSVFKTCSIKKVVKRIRMGIIHPLISSRVVKINEIRKSETLAEIQIAANDNENLVWIISEQSKVEGILAMLSRPRMIIKEGFITFLEKNPLIEIEDGLLKKFEVVCRLNQKSIQGKQVVLLDSVMGSSSLQKIVESLKGGVTKLGDFLFNKTSVDYVISNKKSYVKMDKQKYQVLTEANFIDSLIQFQQQK